MENSHHHPGFNCERDINSRLSLSSIRSHTLWSCSSVTHYILFQHKSHYSALKSAQQWHSPLTTVLLLRPSKTDFIHILLPQVDLRNDPCYIAFFLPVSKGLSVQNGLFCVFKLLLIVSISVCIHLPCIQGRSKCSQCPLVYHFSQFALVATPWSRKTCRKNGGGIKPERKNGVVK